MNSTKKLAYFKPETQFYNFINQSWEELPANPDELQDYQAKRFVPQTPRGETIYLNYRATGCNPYTAMLETCYDIMGR